MGSIIVAIPCLNEEKTIRQVVEDFRRALPSAEIIVFDNSSTDASVACALVAGARVQRVTRRGKGAVVQAIFESCQADVTLMVDGDATYPAEMARRLADAVLVHTADMAVGSRLHPESRSTFAVLNRWGNRFFRFAVNALYGGRVTDLLSGYRAFSRQFIQAVRPASVGFEIETELTVRALQSRLQIVEIPVDLQPRPEGSHSKIRLVSDGFTIFRAILSYRYEGYGCLPVATHS